MAFTSTPMPMLMVTLGGDGDWTGLFLKGADGRVPQPLLDAFATFQSELRVFSAECDAFNEKAEGASFPHCFGLWCWNPKYLEAARSPSDTSSDVRGRTAGRSLPWCTAL